jgi:Anaerobic dehydrogenases, typically selenocysteine-containing
MGGCWGSSRCRIIPTGQALCPKGRAAPELVYHPERVTHPLRRTQPKGAADPGWEPIEWDEALAEIAARLSDIRAAHGAEQVAFSVTTPSGSHISDSISWVERFTRAYGSPNTVYGTEICNWHKDYASRFTYGHDIGTPDFANTGCVVLWGNNPAATWLARQVEILKGLKRGARLIVIDPRPTAMAKRATQWLRVRPGTDQAVALGLATCWSRADASIASLRRPGRTPACWCAPIPAASCARATFGLMAGPRSCFRTRARVAAWWPTIRRAGPGLPEVPRPPCAGRAPWKRWPDPSCVTPRWSCSREPPRNLRRSALPK